MRAFKVGLLVTSLVGVSTAGCGDSSGFLCRNDTQCVNQFQGRCEPTGFCSFPDADCATGYRYGMETAGSLAGLCVPPGSDNATDESGSASGGESESETEAVEAICGDGIVEGDEECDAADLGARTCIGEGFTGGALVCNDNCSLDTSNCNLCGNGAIECRRGV